MSSSPSASDATRIASSKYNPKNSGVKRILQEAKELAAEDSSEMSAAPLEDNLFEWHFTIRGPQDTDFQDGIYHGRIILPAEYPFRPPNLMLLTPNGRFELNKKICLSITGYHEDLWQPAWGIRTALMGLVAFFNTPAKGAIGGLDAPPAERKKLAKSSQDWCCSLCGQKNKELVEERASEQANSTTPTSVSAAATATPPPATDSPAAVQIANVNVTQDGTTNVQISPTFAGTPQQPNPGPTAPPTTPRRALPITPTTNATSPALTAVAGRTPPREAGGEPENEVDGDAEMEDMDMPLPIQPIRRSRDGSPFWLDSLILGLICTIVWLMYRKIIW